MQACGVPECSIIPAFLHSGLMNNLFDLNLKHNFYTITITAKGVRESLQ